ncbi:helix-turn-helix domain-containing protein [Streptomyces sp. NPDC002952]|uniref:helix-turn-helix domain-containing protein n=1 Tax=Streptomyces sp. NPDC002952 TaxID=3364673 RepID=UPI0036AC184A
MTTSAQIDVWIACCGKTQPSPWTGQGGGCFLVCVTSLRADELGPTLRRLRQRRGLTQRQLAEAAGTHVTHISRVESGERVTVSRGLLERLGDELGAPAELAAAAGRVPARAEQALCQFPDALQDAVLEGKTLPALRRLAASAQAQRLLSRTPGGAVEGGRIEPNALCRQLRLQPVVRPADDGPPLSFEGRQVIVTDPGQHGDPAALPRIRFLIAHAAAHALEEQLSCVFPRMGSGEELACDVAAYLLCPSPLLEGALRSASLEAGPDAGDPWVSDIGAVVTAVARKLGVPGWVAIRRLADEALLDDEALYYTLGDRP